MYAHSGRLMTAGNRDLYFTDHQQNRPLDHIVFHESICLGQGLQYIAVIHL